MVELRSGKSPLIFIKVGLLEVVRCFYGSLQSYCGLSGVVKKEG